MRASPRYIAVTVPGSTPVNLLTLLRGIDADTEQHCQQLEFEEAIAGGVKKTYVGNSDLSIAGGIYGVILVAGAPTIFPSLSSNLISLTDIWLATDGTNIVVGVTIVTR